MPEETPKQTGAAASTRGVLCAAQVNPNDPHKIIDEESIKACLPAAACESSPVPSEPGKD